jgi:hypothetical protein
MPRQTVKLPGGRPSLDLVSYGRGGPGGSGRLSPAQIDHIRRTVQRVPEVMVKVLSSGSSNLKAVGGHIDYIGRKGALELETDDGDRIQGRDAGQALLDDWDLDIDELRPRADLVPTNARKPPKLVHKLIFSMPAGTPPEKVMAAVRNFAREEFALKHRYAFVLHTDEPHPHVHLLLKATNEQGVRLNIKKETLRRWRSEFAQNLRELGIAANATERAVRGQSQKAKKDGIYRAGLRGESVYIRDQAKAVAAELSKGNLSKEVGKRQLLETRRQVENGWQSVANLLIKNGRPDLAGEIHRFVEKLSPVRTERELVAHQLQQIVRQRRREIDRVR